MSGLLSCGFCLTPPDKATDFTKWGTSFVCTVSCPRCGRASSAFSASAEKARKEAEKRWNNNQKKYERGSQYHFSFRVKRVRRSLRVALLLTLVVYILSNGGF